MKLNLTVPSTASALSRTCIAAIAICYCTTSAYSQTPPPPPPATVTANAITPQPANLADTHRATLSEITYTVTTAGTAPNITTTMTMSATQKAQKNGDPIYYTYTMPGMPQMQMYTGQKKAVFDVVPGKMYYVEWHKALTQGAWESLGGNFLLY